MQNLLQLDCIWRFLIFCLTTKYKYSIVEKILPYEIQDSFFAIVFLSKTTEYFKRRNRQNQF